MAHVGQVGTFLFPEWRGQGVGRRLWNGTQSFARQSGYLKLAIQVRATNTIAQSFNIPSDTVPAPRQRLSFKPSAATADRTKSNVPAEPDCPDTTPSAEPKRA